MRAFKRGWAAATAAMAILAGGSALAQTATTTFSVTATVVEACNVSASTLAFGNYNPVSGADVDQTTTISVTCSSGGGYDIGLNAGIGSGSSIATRKMTGTPSGTLEYTLYSNPGRTTVWGNNVGSDTLADTGTGAAQSQTVYGRIFGTQSAAPPVGSYADTITVTVTF